MAIKKNKSQLIIEELDKYILKNFNKVPITIVYEEVKAILNKSTKLRKLQPEIITIFTLHRYKNINFYEKYETVEDIVRYYDKILTEFCYKCGRSKLQVPNEMIEQIKDKFYLVNPDVKKLDNDLIFINRNYCIKDEDVQELIEIKSKRISKLLRENSEILNRSIFLTEWLTKKQFGEA